MRSVTDDQPTAVKLPEPAELGGTPQQLAALRQCLCTDVSRAELITLIRAAGVVPPELPVLPGKGWMTQEHGPRVGVRHDGDLGQHLIVHQEAKLVAVRLIAWGHPKAREKAGNFAGFNDPVLSLVAP